MRSSPMLLALLLMLIATMSSGCSDSQSQRTELARQGVSADARHSTALVSAETGTEKHYLNDGDFERVGDGDGDNNADNDKDPSLDYLPSDHKEGENNRYHDVDDSGLLGYGRAASPAEQQAVSNTVERYYLLAAAENGVGACAQLIPTLATAVPSDYGANGPAYLHAGKTCAAVMTLLFKHYHKQLQVGIAVTGVRISGNQADALLGSTEFPPSYILVQRELDGTWKIAQLLGTENRLP